MERVNSIDFIRAIAITAVISIHTMPFNYGGVNIDVNKYLFIGINQLARFAVPFFFIISGYFFAAKVKNNKTYALSISIRMVKRLLMVWIFFSAIYLVPFELLSELTSSTAILNAIDSKLNKIFSNPVDFIFIGTQTHLWFLISLSLSSLITAILIKYIPKGSLFLLITLSVCLYFFGLLAKAYSVTSYGIDISFDTRNGPFFSTIFFTMGYALSYFKFSPKHIIHGLVITIIGYCLHFGEVFYLYSKFDISPSKIDYVVGTLFIGLGFAIMAFSNHQLLENRSLSCVGKNTLGIYTIHMVYVNLFDNFSNNFHNAAWEVSYIFIVLFLSLATTMLFSKNKYLRRFLI